MKGVELNYLNNEFFKFLQSTELAGECVEKIYEGNDEGNYVFEDYFVKHLKNEGVNINAGDYPELCKAIYAGPGHSQIVLANKNINYQTFFEQLSGFLVKFNNLEYFSVGKIIDNSKKFIDDNTFFIKQIQPQFDSAKLSSAFDFVKSSLAAAGNGGAKVINLAIGGLMLGGSLIAGAYSSMFSNKEIS